MTSNIPSPTETAPAATDLQVSRLLKGGLADWQVNAVRALVLNNLEERFSTTRLAAVTRLSRGHFCKTFRKTCGITPKKYVLRIKIEAARRLLMRGGVTLSEIALQCGFSDQSHFSRAFRSMTGHPPLQWLKKNAPQRSR